MGHAASRPTTESGSVERPRSAGRPSPRNFGVQKSLPRSFRSEQDRWRTRTLCQAIPPTSTRWTGSAILSGATPIALIGQGHHGVDVPATRNHKTAGQRHAATLWLAPPSKARKRYRKMHCVSAGLKGRFRPVARWPEPARSRLSGAPRLVPKRRRSPCHSCEKPAPNHPTMR